MKYLESYNRDYNQIIEEASIEFVEKYDAKIYKFKPSLVKNNRLQLNVILDRIKDYDIKSTIHNAHLEMEILNEFEYIIDKISDYKNINYKIVRSREFSIQFNWD